jgi:TonB family protein
LPLADPDFLKNIEDRQRKQNEQITLWSVQQITTAEKAYQSAHGGFGCSLSALGGAGKQPGTKNGAYLYDPQLASGKKSGYIFAISGCDASHFKIVAEPAAPGSGQRAFCSDESGTIRASADGKATTCLSSGEPLQDAPPALNVVGDTISPAQQPSAESGQRAPVAQRIRVSEGVSQTFVNTRVQPVYPADAKSVQGAVVMRAIISKTGDVRSLDILSGPQVLSLAALNAAKQWKYRPYLLNGNPIEVETQITINFTPNGH